MAEDTQVGGNSGGVLGVSLLTGGSLLWQPRASTPAGCFPSSGLVPFKNILKKIFFIKV